MGAQNFVDSDYNEVRNTLVTISLGDRANNHELVDHLVACNGNCNEDILSRFAIDDNDAGYLRKVSKVLAELNPKNKSRFEDELKDLIDIDIFKGVKDLDNLSAAPGEFVNHDDECDNNEVAIDSNTIGKWHQAGNNETYIAGINYVKNRIIHYLVSTGITKNILVEYSLLSSTLEPTNPDKLQCISFAIGDDDFQKRVNTYYTECIRQTNELGISVYQHPQFLYNIELKKKSYEPFGADDGIKTYSWSDDIGVTGTVKCDYDHPGKDYTIYTDKKRNPDYKPGSFRIVDGIYVDAFKLERSFNEMLQVAKKLDGACASLVDIQNTLHSFCHKNISEKRHQKSAYISFPVYGSRASNQLPQYDILRTVDKKTALQGIGAFFIYFEPDVDMNNSSYQKLLMAFLSKIAYEMGNFIRLISANYMFNLGLQLQENARREAIKSAKAAIMSRNMSHNLGSHVMSYLKQNLSSVNNIFKDRILSLLVKDLNSLQIDDEIRKAAKEGDQGILPFLVGLGQFISYIQERQDFIATIATDYVPYLSAVNFKDFIYDVLNPDKRYERHSTRQNYKTDNILLGNIARSEGLGRKTTPTEGGTLNDIVLYFRDFDGGPVEEVEQMGKVCKGRERQYRTLQDMRPYEFSLPGGVVGRQAIFSIVENVIRNAAKHGNWREKGELDLTIDIFTKDEINLYNEICKLEDEIKSGESNEGIKDKEEQLEIKKSNLEKLHYDIESKLQDNKASERLSLAEVFNRFYLNAIDSKDLYFITLTDNLSMDDPKLEKLRKAIKEPLVDEQGKMKEASKGIKEMRISSAWIRNLREGEAYNPITDDAKNPKNLIQETEWKEIENDQNAPALYARISNENLQYIFCVLRPKKVAIISTVFKDNLSQSIDEKAFHKASWGAFTPKQYFKERNKSYEFLIYDDINNQEDDKMYQYEVLRSVSSTRFWRLSDIEGLYEKNTNDHIALFEKIKELSEQNIREILTILYKKLAKYNEESDYIYIDDKTALANDNRRISDYKKHGDSEIGYKKSDHVYVKDGIGEGKRLYIYRTHHDTKEQYDNFVESINKRVYTGNVFVEGITGNNSTDRLVRNEKLDDTWFYKHLHAMKERIAIFDERLFTKLFGLEETHLRNEGTINVTDINRTGLLKRYKKVFLKNDENNKEWESLLDKTIEDQDALLKNAFKNEHGPLTSKIEEDIPTGVTPIVYKQKGVYLFTLIQEPNLEKRNTFSLYGLSLNDSLSKGKCEKISTLSWNLKTGLKFEGIISDEDNKYMRFDRISIHQGILDKLYEVFGIKDEAEEKERLTRKFFTVLSNQESEKQLDVLPGMSIHSGRSKPSKDDMPQQLPFIQYASIENAVLDCKYSLVELLDFARYE